MQVQWERRKLAHPSRATPSYRLEAVLVGVSVRNGKRQLKPIALLGSIEEKFLFTRARDIRAFHQGLFWIGVDQKLAHLNLDKEVKGRIEAGLSEKVPRPNPDWELWAVTCIPKLD